MRRGLLIYAAAGLICLLAGWSALSAAESYRVLILGRLVLGLGESVVMVGMMGWVIGLMGQARSGHVISLVGMGMYGAFAAGGPLGLALLDRLVFASLMVVCTMLPLVGLVMINWLPAVPPTQGQGNPSGGSSGVSGVPVPWLGCRVSVFRSGAFFSLYFLSRGWSYAGLGLTFFGVGFVLVRLLCGHLPDRIEGTRVAFVSLLVEACGQYLTWLAPGPHAALVGALLTGLGCSMVFPSMGTEVMKRVPPHLRGTAIGGFAAFQDLAYGVPASFPGCA